MTTIDEATLARLVELDAAATPGPWHAGPNDLIGGACVASRPDPPSQWPSGGFMVADLARPEDADLIAVLRNAAPDLLAAARALGQVRGALLDVRAILADVQDGTPWQVAIDSALLRIETTLGEGGKW